MNKTIKFIVLISAVIFLVFGILAAVLAARTDFTTINKQINSGTFRWGFGEDFTVHTEENLKVEGITHITINTVSTDVVLYTSDSMVDVVLDCTGYTTGAPVKLVTSTVGNTLNIKIEYPKLRGLNIVDGSLQIGLPESYAGEIKINSVSSDTSTQGLLGNMLARFSVDTISGDANVSWAHIEELYYSSTSGDTLVQAEKIERVQIDTTSGTLEVRGISEDCTFVKANSVSGKVILDYNELCKTKVDTVSGNVILSIPEGTKIDLDFDSVSGDVDGNYNKNTSGVEVIINTVSGDLKFE